MFELESADVEVGAKGEGLQLALAIGLRVPRTFVMTDGQASLEAAKLRAVHKGAWIVRPSVCIDASRAAELSGWLESPIVPNVDGILSAVRHIEHQVPRSFALLNPALRKRLRAVRIVFIIQPYLATRLSGVLHTCDDYLGLSVAGRVSAIRGHLSALNSERSGRDFALRRGRGGTLELIGGDADVLGVLSSGGISPVFQELVEIAERVKAATRHPAEVEWLARGGRVFVLQVQRLPGE
jgi:hypothetical protein